MNPAPSYKPYLAKEVDATLNQYLASGLIQHSKSPYSSPLVVILKKSGGVWITVKYKKLNQINKLKPAADSPRGPGPRLLGLRTGVFPVRLGFLVPPDKGAQGYGPLTAFCTPTGLYEWLVMPLGSSALPGWFVKVINEVIKD